MQLWRGQNIKIDAQRSVKSVDPVHHGVGEFLASLPRVIPNYDFGPILDINILLFHNFLDHF